MENKKFAVRLSLLLILVGGIIMSFMIPHWQIPDENAHLEMIGTSLKNEQISGLFYEDMPLEANRIRFQYNEKINIEQWKAAMTQKPSYKRMECIPKGVSVSVIKHLPAALGIALGTWIYLPTFWVMQLAEFFSLLFYVGICGIALKIMPIKKEIMLMLMAFPMTLQQAGSINYDSVLLPISFLYVSYIFYMYYVKERLSWKEVAITLLLLFWIAYIKVPYIFLGLLVFVLPKEKIHLRIGKWEINGEFLEKWRIVLVITGTILVIAAIYAVRENHWTQLVIGMALEWKRTLYLFAATAAKWGKFLTISSVGQFGYLDSALPFGLVLVSYTLMIVMAVFCTTEENEISMKRKSKVYIWIVFIILCAFIVMSMVNHTITVTHFNGETIDVEYNVREMIYHIPYVGGLQGRYFLPFLILPFLTFPTAKKDFKWRIWLIPIYQVVMLIATVYTLYWRYWVG